MYVYVRVRTCTCVCECVRSFVCLLASWLVDWWVGGLVGWPADILEYTFSMRRQNIYTYIHTYTTYYMQPSCGSWKEVPRLMYKNCRCGGSRKGINYNYKDVRSCAQYCSTRSGSVSFVLHTGWSSSMSTRFGTCECYDALCPDNGCPNDYW